MNISRIVKVLILSIIIPISCAGGFIGYNFCAHNNVNYETDDKKVMHKVDGIFGHTSLEINKSDDSVKIRRYNPLDLRLYYDYNRDNTVDRVYREGILFLRNSQKSFYIDRDLKEYPIIFQEANKDFMEQMQRFGY